MEDEHISDDPRSDGEDFRPKYKFNDEGKAHEHLLWSDRKEGYEQLTGVTTIIDVLGKVLTWWASGKAVEVLGWTNSKIKVDGKYQTIPLERRLTHLKPIREAQSKLSDTDYLSLLDNAYKAHSIFLDKSADAGTDLHELLERYVKMTITLGNIENVSIEEIEKLDPSGRVKDFHFWALKNVKKFLWSEAYCYDEILFVGGITDVGAEMKDGTYAIIDFKSAKEAYFNHFVQIAIYNLLIEKNGLFTKDGEPTMKLDKEISKYYVIPFGASKFTVSENANVKGLKESGLACVKLYREKSKFENG